MTIVCQGGISNTKVVIVTEIGDRVSYLMQTFNTDRGNIESRFEGLHGGAAISRKGEVGWVGGLETCEEVDLSVSECNSYEISALGTI